MSLNLELLISVLILGISIFSPVVLFCLVWKRNAKSQLRTFFFAFQFSVVLWAVFNFLSVSAFLSPDFRFLCIRAVMCLAIWQSVTFLLFVLTFPYERIQIRRVYFFTLLISSSVTSILCFSNLIFSDFIVVDNQLKPTPGPGVILHVLNSVGIVIIGVGILYTKLQKSTGFLRGELYALLLGFSSTFSLLVFFIFIFVTVFHNAFFVAFGGLFFLPLVFSMAYAMLLYRFFGVEFSVHKNILILFSKVLILFVLSSVGIFVYHFFPSIPFLILDIVTSCLAYNFFARRVEQKWLNQLFFFDRLDASLPILQEVHSDVIAPLMDNFVESIKSFCHKNDIEYRSVFVLHREKYMFLPLSSEHESFNIASPMATALFSLPSNSAETRVLELMRSKYSLILAKYMKEIGSNALVLLRSQHTIVGVIFLDINQVSQPDLLEDMHSAFSSTLISILTSKEGVFAAKSNQY